MSPKTVEEYYQQIGRAGRDGGVAKCVLYQKPSDFTRFKAPFWTNGMTPEAKNAVLRSGDALRSFAEGIDCRRRMLLQYFGEEAQFERCGTCDNCSRASPGSLGALSEHNYAAEAAALLSVVNGLWDHRGGQSWASTSKIRKKLSGSSKTSFDFTELLPALLRKGYLTRSQRSMSQASWDVYALTPLGRLAMTENGLADSLSYCTRILTCYCALK